MTPQLDELLERKRNLETRIQEGIDELIDVITLDIPDYLGREVRKRFIAAVDQAEDFDEATVQRIKASIQERAESLEASIRETLSSLDIWLEPDVPAAEGKSIAPNTEVWRALQTIAEAVPVLLESHNIPQLETDHFEYQTPSMFIKGKYAPGLIETYWSRLAQYRLLNTEVAKRNQELTRERLAKLWDDVS